MRRNNLEINISILSIFFLLFISLFNKVKLIFRNKISQFLKNIDKGLIYSEYKFLTLSTKTK